MVNIDYTLLLVLLVISIIFNFFLLKSKIFNIKNNSKQVQDIHFGNPPRLGGFVILILFFLCQIFYIKELNPLFFISIIILLPAILEDFKIRIKPIFRLFAILTASLIIIMNFPGLPQFEFGILNTVFNNRIFQIIFFTIAMATVINGQNIIDGSHGLSAMSSMAIFACILSLGFALNDQIVIEYSLIVLVLILGFLIFNYPFGYIFLGDTGSYFLGFLASYFVIHIFSKYPEIPSWSAVTILFYPTLEVLFSYFRKIIQNKSPFMPDNLHLHIKIYYLLSQNNKQSRLNNALVTPFLGVVWLSPLALMPFSLHYPIWSLFVLMLLFFVYLFFYLAIPNPQQNN